MIAEQFPALIVVTPLILSFVVNVVGLWNKRLCFPIVAVTLLYVLFKKPDWFLEWVRDIYDLKKS